MIEARAASAAVRSHTYERGLSVVRSGRSFSKNKNGMEDIVLFKSIPDSLKNLIARDLSSYSIAFLNLYQEPHGPGSDLLGSGTLVQIGGKSAILTAQHVASRLPTSGRVGLLLSRTGIPHSIDAAGCHVCQLPRGSDDALGPDLAAVILAPSIASSIGAKKSFAI